MYNLSRNAGMRSETLGATTASSTGTTITAAGSANTKGSWTTIGTSTFDYEYVIVCVGHAGGAVNYVVDIGIQSNSGDRVLIQDLRLDATRVAASRSNQYGIPVHFPSGSVIRARSASSTLSSVCRVIVIGFSRGFSGGAGYSRCIALCTATVSRGITIDNNVAVNTKGAWTSLTTTSVEIAAIFGHIGLNADIARGAVVSGLIDIGIGTATNFTIVSNITASYETTNDIWMPSVLPVMPIGIPANHNVVARHQTSATTAGDRAFDLMLYGLIV